MRALVLSVADAQQFSTSKPDARVHQGPVAQPITPPTQQSELTWKERLGIRHLTDEEWAQYELDKQEQMQQRQVQPGLTELILLNASLCHTATKCVQAYKSWPKP